MAQPNPAGTIAALLAATLLASAARAQDEGTFDRTPDDCIAVQSIDRTDVIDDNTILFFMRGKKVYRNYLPRKCPGLERNERFSYQVTGNRLCDIDTVTVLEQWGSRLSSGFTCSLGAFHPIPPEEVEELVLLSKQEGRKRDAIDVEEVDLPEDDAEAAGEGEPADADAEAAQD